MPYLPLEPLPRFIAQVIAILLLSRLLGRFARRVGQPLVVAEIIAGILLGPSVLGFVAPDLSAALFAPESLVLLEVVSSLGLVLFMFLIGLEVDLTLLRERGRASLVVSQATLLAPLVLGALLALYLYPRWASEGVSQTSFALFVGATLSITAFPVLARIVAERGLVRSPLGTLALACAAIDDVLAWCLLAFVFASVRTSGLASALATTGLAILYIGLMFVVVRPLLERLARRVGRGVLSNDRVAAVMLLLFASSWATELIGLHALFGAFLFGAIMPRGGGLSNALAEKLGDVVMVVLLPLFFAYSGVRTQIGLLDSSEAWLTCGLFVLVAFAAKLGAGTFAARLTGLSWRESGAIGALMNTRGLIVLIALNLGLDFGIIDSAVFSMLVVMSLVTTFAAKPILDAIYPSDQHIRDLLTTSRAPAEARLPREPVHRVLACVSDARSAPSLYALARVLSGDDARVHALALRSPEMKRDVAGLVAGIKPTSFASTEPARDICRMADAKAADLVLLARRPRQGDTLLGRTSARVMVECTRNVAVLLSTTQVQTRDVLVVHEGPHADLVRRIADRLAARGANVVEQHGSAAAALERRGFDLIVAGMPDEAGAEALAEGWQASGHGTSLLVVRGALASEARAIA
jgi:Kef-type K+ transport system membrane component KefB